MKILIQIAQGFCLLSVSLLSCVPKTLSETISLPLSDVTSNQVIISKLENSVLGFDQSKQEPVLLAFNSFTDIDGVKGQTEIQQLVQLGVIETNSSNFNPLDPITRGQFVTWLVKAYNQLHDVPIPVGSNRELAFSDLSVSHPDFNYIQAAYDAGYIVGFEDGTFQPNNPLTREQMIALKSQLDSSGSDSRNADRLRHFASRTMGYTDVEQMSDQYLKYLVFDAWNAAGSKNFVRVYGQTRIYSPKRPVTRAEAAILLTKFRKGKPIEKVLESR
ncbi:S-layer homology domain-containing protein [Crocosphaera subtropica]|nr:S-layer homology domain-containing protein [Crocosphaera subtropica]